jgi:plasmid stabilization system protein ParE
VLGGAWRMAHIRSDIDALAEYPCLYAVGPHSGRREFSSEGYRIVYRVVPDTGLNATSGDVQVLRVFGPGQFRGPGVAG